jgi:hypothetical protein
VNKEMRLRRGYTLLCIYAMRLTAQWNYNKLYGIINYMDYNFMIKGFYMKNTVKLFGIIALVAVIGLSMAACEDNTKGADDWEDFEATTTGSLIISGLSAYEGQTIEASGGTGTSTILACYRAMNIYSSNENKSMASTSYPATATSDTVTLKVFENKGTQSGKGGGWQSYTGNDQGVEFHFMAPLGGTATVNFSNGQGSGVFVPFN